MAQKYGSVADQVAARPARCDICDDDHPRFSWTDRHGEAYCVGCGVPYDLIRDGRRITPECLLKDEWVPVVKEYVRTVGRGIGGGTFVVTRDYPRQIEDRRAFHAWLEREHPGRVP